jgi:hypothetical protein
MANIYLLVVYSEWKVGDTRVGSLGWRESELCSED